MACVHFTEATPASNCFCIQLLRWPAVRRFCSLCNTMPSPPLLLFVNIDNTATPLIWGYTLTQPGSQPGWWCGHLGKICYPNLCTWVGLGYSSAHLSSWVDLCSPFPHVNRNMRPGCISMKQRQLRTVCFCIQFDGQPCVDSAS